MLVNKLLKKPTYDTDFETRTLELLKLRFAESELHHCDVMLKDMQARALLSAPRSYNPYGLSACCE